MNKNQAVPIWGTNNGKDSWKLFESSFLWDQSQKTLLEISAESTFEILLNGIRLPMQQLSDFPQDRTYSEMEIDPYLKAGENHIRIIVHWNGENFSTSIAGQPYLWVVIRSGDHVFTGTCAQWKCADAAMYHSGLSCRVSYQLGFVYEYDARLEDDFAWWEPVVELNAETVMPHLRKRSIPQLLERPPVPAAIVQTGVLLREKTDKTFARTCMNDWLHPVEESVMFPEADQESLSHRNLTVTPDSSFFLLKSLSQMSEANGYYITLDLQKECAGYFYMKLKASAGTVIDISHGEHLNIGRVSSAIESRNFTDRYICREGINEFKFTHRRIAGRFIELHITNVSDDFRFCYAGICPAELPLPESAGIETEDRSLKRLMKLSADTLHLCMHEHYEDTPWREQSLYAYDSRNQMLFGYYLWGNGDFAENSLNLLGNSFDQERYLALTAPGKCGLTIPVFTMIWITALKDHLLYTGNKRIFQRWAPLVERILDRALSVQLDNGLCFPGESENIWNFCEWNGKLSGLKNPMQSPYNLYLTEALRSVAVMYRFSGDLSSAEKRSGQAEKLAECVKKVFFDPKENLFSAEPGDTEFYEHIQSIACMQCMLSAEEKGKLLELIMKQQCRPAELSVIVYLIDALMSGTPESRKYLLKMLNGKTDVLLNAGASSFWETLNGSTDFSRAGSLSHAWGAFVPYFTGRYLLGITPITPGFQTFRLKIWCGDYTHLAGSVPTPNGFIHVSWKLNNGVLEAVVKHPAGLKMEQESFDEFPIGSIHAFAY